MVDTVLDSLIVKINADTRGLDQGLTAVSNNLNGLAALGDRVGQSSGALNEGAVSFSRDLDRATTAATINMSRAFDRMARTGRLSFDGLKDAALSSLAQIVAGYAGGGLDSLFRFGASSLFSMFLPGRSGGGAVSRGQAYVVGERGPELFVPTSAGRISTTVDQQSQRQQQSAPIITINIHNPSNAQDSRQSATQVARAVRRALDRAR